MVSDPEKTISSEPPRLAVISSAPPPPTFEVERTSGPLPAGVAVPDLKTHFDFLWNTHKYSNDYIRFADTKAAFTVALTSAILGALFKDGAHQLFLGTTPKAWTPTVWMAFAAFVCLGTAIGTGVWAIRPRLFSRQQRALIYWNGVREHGAAESFWDGMKARSQEQLTEHLAHHVFGLSEVAKQKYFWVSFSMTAAAMGGGFAALTLLFR